MQSDFCIPPRPGPSDWRPGSKSCTEGAAAGPHPSLETEAGAEDFQSSNQAGEWQSPVGQL